MLRGKLALQDPRLGSILCESQTPCEYDSKRQNWIKEKHAFGGTGNELWPSCLAAANSEHSFTASPYVSIKSCMASRIASFHSMKKMDFLQECYIVARDI